MFFCGSEPSYAQVFLKIKKCPLLLEREKPPKAAQEAPIQVSNKYIYKDFFFLINRYLHVVHVFPRIHYIHILDLF